MKTFDELRERALTPAEKKKREDVAKAIERDNPDMPMAKKMAIATATAKKSVDEKHKVRCPECNGRGCDHCDNTGYHMKESVDLEEATAFRVSIEGLPNMFMYGSGPGQVLAKLRKIVKQPSMIHDVERVTKADVKKSFRLKAQGREEEEMDESTSTVQEVFRRHSYMPTKNQIGRASDEPDTYTRGKQGTYTSSKPPFDPDPPKKKAKNSDGSTTTGSSRAKQLAKQGVPENNNAPQTPAHRRAMLPKKVKLKGFGPDQAKGNMGNPSARASLKVGTPKLRVPREAVEEANNKTGADWEKSFTKKLKYSTSDNPKVKSYLARKQDQRTDRNKAMDPGAAKKGLAISVIDREKAYAKGKKKGIGVMDIDTRPGKDHKTGKSNYGKKLPDSVQYEEMTPQQKADRLALIKKLAKKHGIDGASKAKRDAMSAIKKDKYLTRDMDESASHQDIIARAQAKLTAAEKNNDQEAARKHRATISKHQLALARENWEK